MGIQAYENALTLLADRMADAEFEPQPEERVRRAEEALGVCFPPSYRRFLLELGAGGVGSEEIYGLINDDFDDIRPPQVVGLTRRLRREGQISDSLVVIYNLGQGSYFALDTGSRAGDSEAPVVGFTPGLNKPGDDLEIVAPDFGRFFLDTVRAALR